MSGHRLVVLNAQFERFSTSPTFGPRVGSIAKMIDDQGADCLVVGEAGYSMCQRLADKLGDDWQYDRAQGSAAPGHVGEGLNSVWTKRNVFAQPEAGIDDYNLNSYGQWQRTFLLTKITEKADPTAFVSLGGFHFAAKGAPLGVAGADRAKLAQTKQVVAKIGDRRVLIAGDFPRTLATDDERYFARAGYRMWGRGASTPLCALTQHAVAVTAVATVNHGRMFDHNAKVIAWSVTGKKDA